MCRVRTLGGGRGWQEMSKESLWYVLPDFIKFAVKLELSTILHYEQMSFPQIYPSSIFLTLRVAYLGGNQL